MRSTSFLGLVVVALIAGACALGGTPASPSASGAPPASASGDLQGRTFLSTAITGRTLASDAPIRLRFDGVHLGASAGCNQMSGEWDVVDGVLQVGTMGSTEMGCEAPLMAQDTWLAGFLGGAALTLDGDTLTLAKDGVTVTLLDREVADPDRSLEGTRWVVTGIEQGQAVSSVPAGVEASLTFAGGRVDVATGCNSGSGTYTAADGVLTFGPIGLTKRACVDPAAAQLEAAVLMALAGNATVAIDAGSMTLRAPGVGLQLAASD